MSYITLINIAKSTKSSLFFLESIRAEDLSSEEQAILVDSKVVVEAILQIINQYQSEIAVQHLEDFLKRRWRIIAGSFFTYTHLPGSIATEQCLLVAKFLHQSNPQKKTMQYLMPSITATTDKLFSYEIDEYNLWELVLSEDHKRLIPADLIFFIDANSGPEILTHVFYEEDEKANLPLSKREQQALIEHSKESKQLYELRQKINLLTSNGQSMGAILRRLIIELRKGGASKSFGGTEKNAGKPAYEGISRFMDEFNQFSKDYQKYVRGLRDGKYSIGSILDILSGFKPNQCTCVEVNARNLEKILKRHPELFDEQQRESTHINRLEQRFENLKNKINKQPHGQDSFYVNGYSKLLLDPRLNVNLRYQLSLLAHRLQFPYGFEKEYGMWTMISEIIDLCAEYVTQIDFDFGELAFFAVKDNNSKTLKRCLARLENQLQKSAIVDQLWQLAITENKSKCVYTLLKHGANLAQKINNVRLKDYLQQHKYWEILTEIGRFYQSPNHIFDDKVIRFGALILDLIRDENFNAALHLINANIKFTWRYNSGKHTGYGALHLAIHYLQYDLIEAILKAGASVMAQFKNGPVPIEMALRKNEPKLLELFFSHIPAREDKSHVVKRLWRIAFKEKKYKCLNLILNQGVDLTRLISRENIEALTINKAWATLESILIFYSQTNKKFLESNLNVSRLIITLAENKQFCIAALLVSTSVNLNQYKRHHPYPHFTALHFAIQHQNYAFAELLLNNGANPFDSFQRAISAAELAFKMDDSKWLELCLKYGTANYTREYLIKLLWRRAITEEKTHQFSILLDAGANPKIGINGREMIDYFLWQNNWHVINELVSYYQDKKSTFQNDEMKFGLILLMAMKKKKLWLIPSLIHPKINVSLMLSSGYYKGFTVLHFAVLYKQYELITELRKLGANANTHATFRLSALELAKLRKDDEAIKLLTRPMKRTKSNRMFGAHSNMAPHTAKPTRLMF